LAASHWEATLYADVMSDLDGSRDRPEILAEVRARITDGRIRPGARITEQGLAEELGISRTPVREALISLGALGQVTRTRSGWRTREQEPEELRDIFRLRACLESFAAFHAAKDGSDEQIAAITLAQRRMQEASEGDFDSALSRAEAIASLNGDFHSAVVAAANNSRLPGVMDAAVVGPLVFGAFARYSDQQLRRSNQMHQAIAEAIEARDPRRAEWLMGEHLMQGWDAIEGLLDGDGGERADPWAYLRGVDDGAAD
jgi:DNA-binding GntR family transcriptional regulator